MSQQSVAALTTLLCACLVSLAGLGAPGIVWKVWAQGGHQGVLSRGN